MGRVIVRLPDGLILKDIITRNDYGPRGSFMNVLLSFQTEIYFVFKLAFTEDFTEIY